MSTPEDGATQYEAWYELLPSSEIPLFAVSPGDEMQAVINETSRGEWQMATGDLTSGIAWSASDTAQAANQSSSWIAQTRRFSSRPAAL